MPIKIYTRTGDMGETGLFGGKRVSKGSLRVEAYGNVDELNAFLGLARSQIKDIELDQILEEIQKRLFSLGADLATPLDAETSKRIPRIADGDVSELEEIIDKLQGPLPAQTQFVFPGGSPAGSTLHVVRTVCRRAERRVVRLGEREDLNPQVTRYLNRLSDLLFVLARTANARNKVPETFWTG